MRCSACRAVVAGEPAHCPRCGQSLLKPVPTPAANRKCPYCDASFAHTRAFKDHVTWQHQEAEATTARATPPSTDRIYASPITGGWVRSHPLPSLAIVLVAGTVLYRGIFGYGGSEDSPPASVPSVTEAPAGSAGKPSDKDLGAFEVCKGFVRDRLKSPSSATWRDPFGDQVSFSGSGEGPYTVAASVDSQNGFGAKLRSSYVCTVTNTYGDRWHLVDLTVNDGGG